MMLYRLHTEDKMDDSVEQIVSAYFDSFTILHSTGYWKGSREGSLIVEIVSSSPVAYTNLVKIAKQINRLNDQDCCMITRSEVTMDLIDGRP